MPHARFPYGIITTFSHLAQKEKVIWQRFMARNHEWAELVDYDICCGTKDRVPAGTRVETEEDWSYLRSWKIDVLAIKGGIHFVIEVRPSADLGAIGGILNKAIMYQREHPGLPEVEPVLITDLERPDMRALCAEHDIGYVVI